MAKYKLTKGELKRQRDALRQYRRYLPTLQLKKQQLQLEIVHQLAAAAEKERLRAEKRHDAEHWAGLLTDDLSVIIPWIVPVEIVRSARNVAGVELPVFERAVFAETLYDLYLTPLWYDRALDHLQELAALDAESRLLHEGVALLRRELRQTTQRVNLFEKVKIPEAEDAIRIIKISIGDQMANAVGRSKIAKRKIEALSVGGPGR